MLSREKLNSRKLAVCILTELLSTGLLVAELIEAEHFVTLTITVVGAYMASQGWVDGKANGSK